MGRVTLTLAVLLCGCSSYQERDNPWPEIEAGRTAVTRPVSLPEKPAPEVIQHEGTEYVAFDAAGRADLAAYSTAAEANTEIASELAKALEAMHDAHDEAVRAGRAEHELAELRGRMLHEERQRNWISEVRAAVWLAIGVFAGAQ